MRNYERIFPKEVPPPKRWNLLRKMDYMRIRIFLIHNWPEIIFVIFALVFSFWLMTKTFGSNPQAGTITIAAKAYSDFAANIPLIRSFSQGANFPPQYPLFPGEPIRYHFLFYLLVGLLEKGGIPLGWALNLPSILSFFALLLLIYSLTLLLFRSRAVAFLSILFFLFNGSFGFYYFFQKHPFSLLQSLWDILNTQTFSAFGPYDQSPVTAFWNLNIYTNQRHFASGLFFVLLVLYILFRFQKKKRAISYKSVLLLSMIVGFLPFWHATCFLMSIVILAGFFLFVSRHRRVVLILITALLLALPQFLYLSGSGGTSGFHFYPGYLIHPNLSLQSFLRFWLLNLGLAFFLIPLGVFFAPKLAKQVFLVVLPVFILGNLFQFSPDIAVNHKFFNLFLILGNMFTAYFLLLTWRKNIFLKGLSLLLIFFLTLSGVIDFFAIKNDRFYTISDAPHNPDVSWIEKNTPPSSVFLNSTYLYHPASLAGRKIFLGWPYFSWSAGYDTDKRGRIFRFLFQERSLPKLCQDLKRNGIGYIAIDKQTSLNPDYPVISPIFEQQFVRLYLNKQTSFAIYGREESCQ